jgi:F0F1-type ATP synthase assembly protein I
MGSLLYIVAVILVIGWAVGYFAYSAGHVIHILLVIALIAIIFQIIRGRRVL